MKICTFFGHRDCPNTIKEKLQKVLEDLITNHDVNTFYVGHQGQFDAIVYHALQELKKTYTHIRVTVVLAYIQILIQSSVYISCKQFLLYLFYHESVEYTISIVKKERCRSFATPLIVVFI